MMEIKQQLLDALNVRGPLGLQTASSSPLCAGMQGASQEHKPKERGQYPL